MIAPERHYRPSPSAAEAEVELEFHDRKWIGALLWNAARGNGQSATVAVRRIGVPATKLCAATCVGIFLAVLVAASAVDLTEARYIHSTYRFSPSDPGDQPPLAAMNTHHQPELSRRQDDDSEADDDDDGEEDQRAAASYRNQDDNGGGGGDNGGSGDNYGDNETDGPYEETPVEQEGQADLERFFDDHLGASDRDGMDKENLPTNLVSLLSEPPQLVNLDASAMRLPMNGMVASNLAGESQLTVVPLAPVVNPIVHPRENGVFSEHFDPLSSLPTIQTSFIRLPDEKMIITRQVTARNSGRGPQSLSSQSLPPPPRPLKFFTEENHNNENDVKRASPSGHFNSAAIANQADTHLDQMAALVGGWQLSPSPLSSNQLRIAPTESLTGTPSRENLEQSATNAQNDASQPSGASSNEIVATEDDDFDRVYVTNETNKPFRIDALGGFDPEEDFFDAAKELEVVASDENASRIPTNGAATTTTTNTRSTNRDLKRRSNQSNGGGSGGDDDLGEALSGSRRYNEQQQQQDQAQAGGGPVPPGQEISFNDPDTETMYEDASETDEVTFGQDDPYQTDLEAEMRQQEYDKLLGKLKPQTNNYQPSTSGSLNVVVDNGSGGREANRNADDDDNDNDNDLDADVDSEYKQEPNNKRQRESMATAAADASRTRMQGRPRHRDDIDDEGAWVNDGVDEMDIPSQSHQNSVLDKAAHREEAAAKQAAKEEAEAAAAAESANKQEPDGGGGGNSAESGQTNDNGEEILRMPNADYLKNDFVEDDSGYAS